MDRKIKNVLIFSFLFIAIVLLAILVHDYRFIFLQKSNDKTWVEIDPLQCGDWRVPVGKDISSLKFPLEANITIWRSPGNIEKINVTVYDVKKVGIFFVPCEACSCKEGYRLYLLVSDAEIRHFLDAGYKKSSTISIVRR